MKLLSADTLPLAVDDLRRLRRWRPYQYSGRWLVACVDGHAVAYRRERDLVRWANRHGYPLETAAIVE
jgi:hypothetical protein